MEIAAPEDVITAELSDFLEYKYNGSSEIARNALRGLVIASGNRKRLEAERRLTEVVAEQEAMRYAGCEITVNYAMATDGQIPSHQQLDRLHSNGYIDFSADDIFRIFNCTSDEEFDETMTPHYEQRLEQMATERRALLQKIESEREAGELPEEFFWPTVDYASPTQELKNAKSGQNKKDRCKFTEGQVSEDELIQRYVKYKIAVKLTSNFDEYSELQKNNFNPAIRRINIGLGFNTTTGIKYSSLQSEIHKATGSPVAYIHDEIVRICETEGWYDFLYPDKNKRYLNSLINASK